MYWEINFHIVELLSKCNQICIIDIFLIFIINQSILIAIDLERIDCYAPNRYIFSTIFEEFANKNYINTHIYIDCKTKITFS